MFFFISKLLSFLLNPILWIVVLLIYLLTGKAPERKKRLIWILLAAILLFSNPFLFDRALHYWEVPAVSLQSSQNYEVAIVLGTIARYDKTMDRLQFSYCADRMFQAVELYRQGKLKKIIYSGGSGSLTRPEDIDGPWVKRYLVTIGIPANDILLEDISRNTHENAVRVKLLIDSLEGPLGLSKRYLLITSAYHMRRAAACFEKAGVRVDPYSTDRISGPVKFDLDYLFVPNAFTFASWFLLSHELFGCFFYKIAGYI